MRLCVSWPSSPLRVSGSLLYIYHVYLLTKVGTPRTDRTYLHGARSVVWLLSPFLDLGRVVLTSSLSRQDPPRSGAPLIWWARVVRSCTCLPSSIYNTLIDQLKADKLGFSADLQPGPAPSSSTRFEPPPPPHKVADTCRHGPSRWHRW